MSQLLTRFGESNGGWASGDFDQDGITSLRDLMQIQRNFGSNPATRSRAVDPAVRSALRRASDLSPYTQEQLDSAESWVIGFGCERAQTQTDDLIALLRDPNIEDIPHVPNLNLWHVPSELTSDNVISVLAAVQAALTWQPLRAEFPVYSPQIFVNASIPDNDSNGVESAITITDDVNVEWAEVTFDASHSYRGNLEIILTSPFGTESRLAERRLEDDGNDYGQWVFTSVRNWGESSLGDWTLSVRDLTAEDTGTFNSWQLNLYGTLAGPDIKVIGGGSEIVDGDTTPSTADDTDFGDVELGESATRSFTIANIGERPLNLTGTPRVTIAGPNAANFEIVSQPMGTVLPGESTSFDVRFTPNGTTTYSATLVVRSNDEDESFYDFQIRGRGIDTTMPSVGGLPDLTDASDSGTSTIDDLTNETMPTFNWPTADDGSSSGIAGYWWAVDDTTPETDGTFTSSLFAMTNELSDGLHTFTYRAVDLAGNLSTEASLSFEIDTQAPSVAVDALVTTATAPPLAGTVDDGTASVSVTVDGKTYSTSNARDGAQHLRIDLEPTLAQNEIVGGATPNLGTQSAGRYVVSVDVAISGKDGVPVNCS